MYLGLSVRLQAVKNEASRLSNGDIDQEIATLELTKDILDYRINELKNEKKMEKEMLTKWVIGEHLK